MNYLHNSLPTAPSLRYKLPVFSAECETFFVLIIGLAPTVAETADSSEA